MPNIIQIKALKKKYNNGFTALKQIDLSIKQGEIFALLGPNGAGKTTLISIICGIVNPTSGSITVAGKDIINDYRETRSMIGLVPQELTLGVFDRVIDSVKYSRGLYGSASDSTYIEKLLKSLSLWDKRNDETRHLSGGMKRRLLIAKALSHQPKILFLDEPTAGVDVELRKDMWQIVENLRQQGVTIILTTHYIEEAEAIADRVGIILDGEMLLVQEKKELVDSVGKKHLRIQLSQPLTQLPPFVSEFEGQYNAEDTTLNFSYSSSNQQFISKLFEQLTQHKLAINNIQTSNTSLEDIFVNFVTKQPQ